MKRSSWLFFALMLILQFYPSELRADTNLTNANVALFTDADNNGYINRGDTIRISCVANFTAPATAWVLAPYVDLSSIGLGTVTLANNGGGNYSANVTLTNWNQLVNYTNRNFTVRATADDGSADSQIVTAQIDLCQVEGIGASAVNNVTGTNRARLGEQLRIQITDNRYQGDPLGGTICTVNLTPIGLDPNTPMTHQGGGVFRVVSDIIPAGINYNGPLTITLNDPMIGHPALPYQTANVIVDSAPPAVDLNGTTVVIQSGNATALPGDVLRITAAVTAFDNEQVNVYCGDLIAGRAAPPLAPTPATMPLVISNGLGNPATWQLDVVLSAAQLKDASLPITIRFYDDNGNITTLIRYIPIDLDAPNVLNPTARVRLPIGSLSPTTPPTATRSCTLEVLASITINVPPDNIIATVDLSEIGASAQYPMTLSGGIDNYMGRYTIPQGTLEDVIDYVFIISVRDTAGNLIQQATTPAIRIDNNPPVISNVLLTSNNPLNSGIVRVGDRFTVQCTVTGIEAGSASVDLTRFGIDPSQFQLLPIGGDSYRRSWILPNANTLTIPDPVVDESLALTVYANDTLTGGGVAHIEQAYTGQLIFDNEPPDIIATDFRSDGDVVPPVLIIGKAAKFYAQVASAPISVTINMAHLNQGNAENMWVSTNPFFPGNAGWYEYVLPGGVTEGLLDGVARSFTVTAVDDAGNSVTADIVVNNIDNKPIKVADFDVNVTYRNNPPDDSDISIINLNKLVDFTVTLDPTTDVADLGGTPSDAATINLSRFSGQSSVASMTYQPVPDHAFTASLDNATAALPIYDVTNHRFVVTLTDKSGNKTIAQSAMRRVDNWPPSFEEAPKATVVGGGSSAKIGDQIRFEVKIKDNEGVAPVVNLSNLGLSSAQAMTLRSSDSGVSLYDYTATIGAGTSNGEATTWRITTRDNDLNYVASITNSLDIDSRAPEVSVALTVSGQAQAGIIKAGENLTFSLRLASDTSINSVTVDLRMIGGDANETMFNADTYATGTLWTANVLSAVTTSEYTNARFTATITDNAGNTVTSNSQLFTEIDCRPVVFNNFGLTLAQDNGVVNPGFAGPGDVVMIWASATYHEDAVLTGNLATGTAGSEVPYATATLSYNSTSKRHEGLITIATHTLTSWPEIAGNLLYRVRAVDNVNNISSTSYAAGDFVVRNTMPVTLNAGINLSPNYPLTYTGSNVLVYNLASSTTGDGLIASVTFANDLIVHRAWLDFREFGTGTVYLSTDNSSSAVTVSGYSASRLPPIEDGDSRRVWLYAIDQAGNATYTAERVFIDNVAPTLVSAEFDGETLSVSLSENFANNTFVVGNWQIVGSSTLGGPEYLTFNATAPTLIFDWSSFQLKLDIDHQRVMSGWASTPIYLKVTNDNATSAVTDMWGNELRPVQNFPITITDSAWREPAQITHFSLNQSWPNNISIDLLFSKPMDQSSLIGTAAVLLLATDTTGTFMANVDYNLGYVFQASSTAQASDTFTWPSANHLRITLCESGRRWIARKLTNKTSQKLYFAARNIAIPFANDFLGKPVTFISPSSPFPGVDNRPVAPFAFRGPPNAPRLNLGTRSLILTASDLLLLFKSPYNNNELVPYLEEPTPNLSDRATGFHNQIILHESNSGSSHVLAFNPLRIADNPQFASSTVTLQLSDNDLLSILALYQNNPDPVWEMTIRAGAFTNIWGDNNLAYLPSDYPGSMIVATGATTLPAALAAVSMSDKPPVNSKLADELIFEVEVFPPDIGGIPLPLQWQITPKAGIFRQDNGARIASGTFISHSERTVDGRLRSVFRYRNATALPANLQSVPAVVNIYEVTDIFGNKIDLTASFAYDLNSKNDSVAEGFTDTASAAIVIDTQMPIVIPNAIMPNDFIGKIPAGSVFIVNFNEKMDQASVPTLSLATSTHTMSFSFSGWIGTATAEFRNNADFTATLPNGVWYYQVTGGVDLAGNIMQPTGATAFPVQVRTYAPEVTAGNVVMRTVQNTISTAELIDQPWSRYVGNAVFSVTYNVAPTQNLPHYLEIYDPADNSLLGKVSLVVSGTLATATFSTLNANRVGPNNYAVRVIDSLNNRTDKLLDIIYDGLPPGMTQFEISGISIGSSTAEYVYFNPTRGDLQLNFVATTTDSLRLAVFDGTATTTQPLHMSGTVGEYFLATGNNYANGSYTLSVVDLAGNIGTGSATRKVVADSIAPTLVSIVPQYFVGLPGPYSIGKCAASETKLVVTFSEPMDADPSQIPVLSLSRGSTTIDWRFVGWVNPDVASTAIYENIGDITSSYTGGQYTFVMTGGRDLAYNARTPATDNSLSITLFTSGPNVKITTYTNQQHIYGTSPQENLGYNPFLTAPSSASIRIDFVGVLSSDPYHLIMASGSSVVGTYTLGAGNPKYAYLEHAAYGGWDWVSGFHPTDASYTLYVVDSANDRSVEVGFRYDTIAPTIDTAISMNGPGIATSTEFGSRTLYHSPAAGSASFNIVTENADIIRLLVGNSIATYVADMSPGLTNHNAFWSSLKNVDVNNLNPIASGPYIITAVDIAGALADGTASRSLLIVDTTPPQLVSAVSMFGGVPASLTGAISTGTGRFRLEFDSGMNTLAASPTLTLATDTVTIAMRATSWISSTTCEFTNSVAIDRSLPPGTYSYLISGARDYAGNLNTPTASGEFTIVLSTREPDLSAFRVESQQQAVFGNQILINRPLSFESYAAGPDTASLTINYRTSGGHPYHEPHLIRLYDSSNALVSEAAVAGAIGGISTYTINSARLGNPGVATQSYSFRVIDSIGNISATYTLPIVYDGIRPTVATAAISTVSNAINSPLYYNEQLHGPLRIRFETTASIATDSLVVVIGGAATHSWQMSSNLVTGISTATISTADIGAVPEGNYLITAADLAGNFANGTASTTRLIIDRTAPGVLFATTTTGLPVVTAPAGGATFTVRFDEDMNGLASATPTLILATYSAQIVGSFTGWISSDTAEFVNRDAISNALPQGEYDCHVIAWDLTGNKLENNKADTIMVRSRGPVVTRMYTTSYQATTASATLASGLEMLIDQPFSFEIAPGAATMSIQLAQIPDDNPASIWLHFMINNTTTFASYPVDLVGLNATFTWNISTGPQPLSPTTYTMRVADANGDLSLESHFWRIDNASPAVQLVTVSGGELATGAVFFNPSRHRYITTKFNTEETESPKLRIRGINSTDTYELTSAGTWQWSTNFEGRYSRPDNLGNKNRLPDGTYALDMVDRAGNEAYLISNGQKISYNVIIDSLAPVVATYSLSQNANPVTSFAPAAGNLDIFTQSFETYSETGIWWIEVLDSTGVRVNRLPLADNGGGTFITTWDGTNASGSLVLDGTYTLVATDYAGNRATLTTQIFARTTPFRVLTTMEQVSSTSARIWFNHDVDPNSWVGAISDPILASPPLTISNLTRDRERAITFDVSPAFEHGISYIFTVATDTIKSVFGAGVASNARTVILIADGRGPIIDDVTFHGLAGQQEFRVEFDENYTAASAGDKNNYTLVSASGAVTIANAVTQSDLRSVILTASPALVENASYTLTASNITDGFGNATSSSYAFKGRDLTPPVLTVSAFSNPANENDIIVVVTSNETLKAAPSLTVAQSNAPVVNTVMQQGAEPNAYMIGVSLSSSYAGNGTLSAEATDLAGNTGYGTNTFVVAYVSSTRASIVLSADNMLALNFSEQSLKSDATVKILQHNLEKSDATGGAIRTSLQRQLRAAMGSLRSSTATDTVLPNHSELIPLSEAYEIGIAKNKIDKGFAVNLKSDIATTTTGIGLFNQVGDSWNFVTASRDKEGAFAARTGSSQIFAIMRDIAAPRLSLAADMELSEPFRTPRPEFRGRVEEAGSGIDAKTVIARIDGGAGQPVQIDSNGNFVFTPIVDLVAGHHDLEIKAADRTGNTGVMAAMRFQVVLPLSIGQIMQYPNPASRRMFIRISANRDDLSSDLVTVNIYDVAGHKVGSLDYIKAVKESWGANQRYLYDIPWDLCNSEGKAVANGVYFARIVVRDPDDPSQKTRHNFKLAVLR